MAESGEERYLTTLREALIEALQRKGALTDARIAAAFAAVPRHLFLPGVPPERVYRDEAIITKAHDGINLSSSSQPAMMALMLGQLAIEPGQRILEIGAGTGYNAALLRFLVGARGQVTTIDVDDDIVAAARAALATFGYGDVATVLGDGGYGYPLNAPYDRIVLTVGADDLLPVWVEQLRPDGILVLPLNLGPEMYSVAFRKLPDGTLISESLTPCGFIRLRGAFASAARTLAVDEWDIHCVPGPRLDPAVLPDLLAAEMAPAPLPADAPMASLFLAFSGEPLAQLVVRASLAGVPDIRLALLDTEVGSGCLLPAWGVAGAADNPARRFGSSAAHARLGDHLAHWQALGRPQAGQLRVRALPHAAGIPTPAGGTIVRPHATFLLTGRDGRALAPATR